MKLELSHLSPYASHEILVVVGGSVRNLTALSLDSHFVFVTAWKGSRERQMIGIENIKPILRPLEDLTKEDFKEELYQYYQTLGIDVKLVNYDSGNDNPFDMTLTVTYKLMDDVFTDILISRGSTSETPYHVFNWLCENHFDVFGLIEKGLALEKPSL